MAIKLRSLMNMLEAVHGAEGTTVLLKRIDSFGQDASQYEPKLRNVSGIDVRTFRKLKVTTASWVAEFTKDPALIEHIALKDRRLTVHEALSRNVNIDEAVSSQLQQIDIPESASKPLQILAASLDDLLEKRAKYNASLENARILKEASDEQLQEWWQANAEEVSHSERLLSRVTRDADWQSILRFLSLIESPRARLMTVMATCVDTDRSIDWSKETWGKILDLLPEPLDDETYRTPMPPYAAEEPPLEWVRFILESTSIGRLREFAVKHSTLQMANDPVIRDNTNALEYVTIAVQGRPSVTEGKSAEYAAAKIVESRDSDAAWRLMFVLDTPLRDELLDELYVLALQKARSNSPSRILRGVLRHGMKRTDQGERSFPDRVRQQISKQGLNFLDSVVDNPFSGASSLRDPFSAHPDHPFLLSLLEYVPGNVGIDGDVGPAGTIAAGFEGRFPDADAALWGVFLEMADGWEGSATELFDTIEATM